MYKQFKTDKNLETKGVVIDYGSFRVTIARAGGSNKKFVRVLEAKTKPFRRAIQTETMDNERASSLMAEVYAEAIILNWESKVGKIFKVGIEPPEDGGDKLLPVTTKNILSTFDNLPDLFTDLQQQANQVALFREVILEDDAGN
jgi:hypothetical protein